MKYVGNCADWIDDNFVEYLLEPSFGEKTPSTPDHYKDEQYLFWKSRGFPSDKISFTFIYKDHFNYNVSLPEQFSNVREWWFSKLNPGDIVPWHADKFKYNQSNIERYWVSMQDYIPGHIFLYGDRLLMNYKKGDIFLFNNPTVFHGAGNLSFIPKLSLQIVTENKKEKDSLT